MASEKSIIPIEAIERRILLIRRQKVMLDSDLAQLYGVSTKRLNEQVKRNRKRFPTDFMFQLSEQEVRGGRKLRPPQEPEVFACLAPCVYRTWSDYARKRFE